MKRLISFFTVLAVVAMTVPAFAHPSIDRFKDGTKTVLLSPIHVRDNVKAETAGDIKSLPFGLVGGVMKGAFYMGKDIVTGGLDVVTSPLEMVKK